MTPRRLSKVTLLTLFFVSGAWAQVEMAKCQPGWEWNRNSLGQDACTIGSTLDASCRGLVIYNYPPLNTSSYYLPPRKDHQGDLTCDCNTVMYSLYMACSSCQGGQLYPWTAWTAACDSVFVSQYPADIPQGTTVPRWAYFNVTTLPNQTYTDANAIAIGRDPEEVPKAINTLTTDGSSTSPGKTTLVLTNSRSSTSTSSPTSSPTSDVVNSPKSKTNVGAIVGGVVGSIVPLSILGVAVFFYMQRRQQKPAEQPQPQSPGMGPHRPHPSSMYGPPVTGVPFTPYNPSDPSTFPPQSPQNSITYTTPPYNANTRGNYSGIPEV